MSGPSFMETLLKRSINGPVGKHQTQWKSNSARGTAAHQPSVLEHCRICIAFNTAVMLCAWLCLQRLKLFLGLTGVVCATFAVCWAPYLHSPGLWLQVLRRLFPLDRGLFEVCLQREVQSFSRAPFLILTRKVYGNKACLNWSNPLVQPLSLYGQTKDKRASSVQKTGTKQNK